MELGSKENKTLITSINLSKIIDYGDDVYDNVWEKQEISDSLNDPVLRLKSFQEIIEPILSIKEMICIITDDITSNELVNELITLSKKGIRIYLICKEPAEESKKFFSKLVGKILIRTSKVITGNILLLDPHLEKSQGYITNSPLFNFKQYNDKFFKIFLNSNQIQEAFNFFKTFFWHYTDFEILNEQDLNIFRRIESSKFPNKSLKCTQFLVDYENKCELKDKIIEMINQTNESIEIISENFIFPPEIYSLLSKKLKNIEGEFTISHELFEFFKNKMPKIDLNKIKIYGSTFIYHNFLIFSNNNERSAIILLNAFQLNKKSFQIGIKLDKEQLSFLEEFLSYIKKKREFRFFNEKKLKDIQNDILIEEKNKFETKKIETSIDKNIGEIESKNFDEFLNKKPNKNFKSYKESYCKKIRYIWTLNPPTLPNLAQKDIIYDKWEKEEKKLNRALEAIKKKIEWIEREINNNDDKSLKYFFLGKEQRLQEIRLVFSNFVGFSLKGLELKVAKEKADQVKKLFSDVSNEISDIKDEIKKSKEHRKWEKQKEEFQIEKARILEELNKIERKVADCKELLEEKNKKKISKTNKKEFEAIIKKIQDDIDELIKKKKKKLNQLKKIEKKMETHQKNLEKIKSKSKDTDDKYFRQILGTKKSFGMKKGDKKLEEKELERYQPDIPSMNLPKIGELFIKKKTNYLVIRTYDEIELGRLEAERYNAKLVVRR